jgi:ubiquinone/menaquinone biosynthesis C-methylase UbiE
MGLISTIAYGAGSLAKTAYYGANYAWSRRASGPFQRPHDPPFQSPHPKPDTAKLWEAFTGAFAADAANIEAGLYAAPSLASELKLMRAGRAYRKDVIRIDRRRLDDLPTEVREDPASAGFPAYYRQNFHWQSGGWFSEESADIYDFQVETIFTGAAGPMRRATALDLLASSLRGHDQRGQQYVDIACGTGWFAGDVARNFPGLPLTAIDLSPAYSAHAARRLAGRSRVRVLCGAAEALPLADASMDRATCIYLFHELPPKVRVAVLAEAARVIKPGGLFILADSIQTGDDPNLDRMLDAFPYGFHEPYFTSWLATDIRALAVNAGFELVDTRQAFLTKALAFRRV